MIKGFQFLNLKKLIAAYGRIHTNSVRIPVLTSKRRLGSGMKNIIEKEVLFG